MCQTELQACHRTAELLRGEHHIRRSESSSLPAVIHTVNLIINHPPSPPTYPPLSRLIHRVRTVVTYQGAKRKQGANLNHYGTFQSVSFFFSFTFCAEEGGVRSPVTSNGIPSSRDSDVVHILVEHQEVRREREDRNSIG